MRPLALRPARGPTARARSILQHARAAVLGAAGLLCAGSVRAERPHAKAAPEAPRSAAESACFDHHELGQELRQAGKLLDSRAAFQACARSECPGAVQRDCERWSGEVAELLPSVVFRVSLDGNTRADVSLSVDGNAQPSALGAPLTLDPGVHRYRVVLQGAPALEGELTLEAGQPAREVAVELHSPEPERARVPLLSWILGGVGVAGTASFVGFGLASRSLEHELEHTCSPLCTESQIDRVRQRSLIANISLGVGLSSLATAGALYFLSRPEDEKPPQPARVQLGLVPLGREGALCNLRLQAF